MAFPLKTQGRGQEAPAAATARRLPGDAGSTENVPWLARATGRHRSQCRLRIMSGEDGQADRREARYPV